MIYIVINKLNTLKFENGRLPTKTQRSILKENFGTTTWSKTDRGPNELGQLGRKK